MTGDVLKVNILSIQMIPNVDDSMAKQFNLPDNHKSIGMFTADNDDVSIIALDDATKKADVKVVYAGSTYGGAANASSKYTGEVIGIVSGPTPAEVKSGMDAICDFIENEACLYSANEDDSVGYYAHCISRCGSYFPDEVDDVEEGQPLAYVAAPMIEAMYALDVALKAADVEVVDFYKPPTVTNCGGALLRGSQSACQAACNAFADAVKFAAANPIKN